MSRPDPCRVLSAYQGYAGVPLCKKCYEVIQSIDLEVLQRKSLYDLVACLHRQTQISPSCGALERLAHFRPSVTHQNAQRDRSHTRDAAGFTQRCGLLICQTLAYLIG